MWGPGLWEHPLGLVLRLRSASPAGDGAPNLLALDASVDLFGTIPHGSGQTILRELLLLADHNA